MKLVHFLNLKLNKKITLTSLHETSNATFIFLGRTRLLLSATIKMK